MSYTKNDGIFLIEAALVDGEHEGAGSILSEKLLVDVAALVVREYTHSDDHVLAVVGLPDLFAVVEIVFPIFGEHLLHGDSSLVP